MSVVRDVAVVGYSKSKWKAEAFVIRGQGEALVEGKSIRLKPGTLFLIEKGERHQILAKGRAPLHTINVYTPPAY